MRICTKWKVFIVRKGEIKAALLGEDRLSYANFLTCVNPEILDD